MSSVERGDDLRGVRQVLGSVFLQVGLGGMWHSPHPKACGAGHTKFCSQHLGFLRGALSVRKPRSGDSLTAHALDFARVAQITGQSPLTTHARGLRFLASEAGALGALHCCIGGFEVAGVAESLDPPILSPMSDFLSYLLDAYGKESNDRRQESLFVCVLVPPSDGTRA